MFSLFKFTLTFSIPWQFLVLYPENAQEFFNVLHSQKLTVSSGNLDSHVSDYYNSERFLNIFHIKSNNYILTPNLW